MTMYDLFTIVIARDGGPEAVSPLVMDAHDSDKGMMVYSSEEAAKNTSYRLYTLYGLHCIPMRLVDYIGYTTDSLPWPPY